MKHYLSGPMSGLPQWNFPAFERAAVALRAEGIDVLSAHEIQHNEPLGVVGSLPWTTYLREDLAELLSCDALIILPNWFTSRGARLELYVALALDMPVSFYSDETGLVEMAV